jgi:hypothetical protein
LLSYPDVASRWRSLDLDDIPSPFLTIDYKWNNSTLRLFSTLATFASAQDVALQELRIESFSLPTKLRAPHLPQHDSAVCRAALETEPPRTQSRLDLGGHGLSFSSIEY